MHEGSRSAKKRRQLLRPDCKGVLQAASFSRTQTPHSFLFATVRCWDEHRGRAASPCTSHDPKLVRWWPLTNSRFLDELEIPRRTRDSSTNSRFLDELEIPRRTRDSSTNSRFLDELEIPRQKVAPSPNDPLPTRLKQPSPPSPSPLPPGGRGGGSALTARRPGALRPPCRRASSRYAWSRPQARRCRPPKGTQTT
eukprot:361368-Chlamydomonas_euryale.AAC.4